MALITCPDCQTPHSAEAAACPKCARPSKASGPNQTSQGIMRALLILLIALGGAAIVIAVIVDTLSK